MALCNAMWAMRIQIGRHCVQDGMRGRLRNGCDMRNASVAFSPGFACIDLEYPYLRILIQWLFCCQGRVIHLSTEKPPRGTLIGGSLGDELVSRGGEEGSFWRTICFLGDRL